MNIQWKKRENFELKSFRDHAKGVSTVGIRELRGERQNRREEERDAQCALKRKKRRGDERQAKKAEKE